MIYRFLTLALISAIILGCDNEENTTQPQATNEEIDLTTPVLTIAELEELENGIEVATIFNVSIQDKSDEINTSIIINEQEILNSNLKSFSFEINPFDYPTGENSLSIITSDSKGNQNELNQTFEVKKLLVSIAAPLVPDSSQLFFSVNTMSGDLVGFSQVTRKLEIVKIYANDDFTPQLLIVTSYEMQPDAIYKANLNSFANIEPGTDLVKFQEAGGLRTENTYDASPYITNDLIIDVAAVNSEKLAKSLFGAGYNHSANSYNTIAQSLEYETQVFFRYQASQSITNAFIYTSNLFIDPSDNQIPIEDFKYLFLEQPLNSEFSFQEFKAPTVQIVNIPTAVNSCFVRTFGYFDQEAIRNHDFRFVYDSNQENTSNTIKVPIIDEFEILRNSMIMPLNDRNRLEVSTLGIKDISLPNWTAVRSEDTINMTGEFDKFTLSFILDNPDVSMQWSFTHKYEESYLMPFESFEFPEEFINYASFHKLNLLDFNSNGIFNAELFDSSEQLEYEDLLFSIDIYTHLGDVYILHTGL